jgi:elongator complex protein 1
LFSPNKKANRLTVRFAVQNPEQADEAVEHMCFLTDAHHLYNTAVGLYDLELTILVAQQAQKVCNALFLMLETLLI